MWEQSGNENKGFAYDTTLYHLIGSGTALKDGTANMWAGKSESTLIGFFGRVNYNYKDMLFASASLRREGSTKFGTNQNGAISHQHLWHGSLQKFLSSAR